MQQIFKQIEKSLNAASEVFLLIAVVSLLALPFAVAGNLNPIAREEVSETKYYSFNTTNVLGAQATDKPKVKELVVQKLAIENNALSLTNEQRTQVLYSSLVTFTGSVSQNIYKITNNTDKAYSILPATDLTAQKVSKFNLKVAGKSYSLQKFEPINLKPGQSIDVAIELEAKAQTKFTLAFNFN